MRLQMFLCKLCLKSCMAVIHVCRGGEGRQGVSCGHVHGGWVWGCVWVCGCVGVHMRVLRYVMHCECTCGCKSIQYVYVYSWGMS